MENDELNYTRCFVFEYPDDKGRFELDDDYSPTPNFESDFDDPYRNTILRSQYSLRYRYQTEAIFSGSGFDGTEKEFIEGWGYIDYYKHTLRKMTKNDVYCEFLTRSVLHFNTNQFTKFLDYHFERTHYLDEFFSLIQEITDSIDEFPYFLDPFVIDRLSAFGKLKYRKEITDWIAEKRKELAKYTGETVAETPQIEQPSEEKRPLHKEQIILLDKLGLWNLPKLQRLSEEQKGILFGRLLGGYNAKNTTDYYRNIDQNSDLNPYKTNKGQYEKNVKEFLESLGIDIQ